jgi:hypothetical protein
VKSSNQFLASPAIYQFHQDGVTEAVFWSDILNGFCGIPVSGVGLSPFLRQETFEQENKAWNE